MNLVHRLWSFLGFSKKKENEDKPLDDKTKANLEQSNQQTNNTPGDLDDKSTTIPENLIDKLCVPFGILMYLPDGEIDDAAIGTYHIIDGKYIIFTDHKGNLYPDDARFTNCLVVEHRSERQESKDDVKRYFCVVARKSQGPNDSEGKRAILFFYTDLDEGIYDLRTDLYLSDNVKILAFDQTSGNMVAIMEPDSSMEIEFEYIDNTSGAYAAKKLNYIIQYKPEIGIYVMPAKICAYYYEFYNKFLTKDLSNINVI